MHIILINGAPRSGKDFAGRMLSDDLPGRWVVTKFAAEVKERCHAAYGIVNTLGTPAPDDYFEDVKDEPCDRFFGLTPRQAYIHFSETYLKAVHGEDIFGRLLLGRINRIRTGASAYGLCQGFIITDSGFVPEAEVLVKEFGPEDITLIRLHRPGYTFEDDSRSLIDLCPLGVKTFDVNSPDGDLPGLLKSIRSKVPFLWRRS